MIRIMIAAAFLAMGSGEASAQRVHREEHLGAADRLSFGTEASRAAAAAIVKHAQSVPRYMVQMRSIETGEVLWTNEVRGNSWAASGRRENGHQYEVKRDSEKLSIEITRNGELVAQAVGDPASKRLGLVAASVKIQVTVELMEDLK